MTESTYALFERWIRDKAALSINCAGEHFSFIGMAMLDSAADDELEFSRGLGLGIELEGAKIEITPPVTTRTRVLASVRISFDSGLQFIISEIDMTPSNVPVVG